MLSKRIRSGLLLGLSLLFFSAHSMAATETMKVIMPWDGNGTLYSISENEMIFQGEFEGIMYVEKASGEWDTAFASCPAQQVINLKSGKGSATGYCEITVDQDRTAYAKWNCKGEIGVCKGKFTLTGGTGKLKGVSGSSDFVVRSVLNVLAAGMGDGSVIRAASGIAILEKLTVKKP